MHPLLSYRSLLGLVRVTTRLNVMRMGVLAPNGPPTFRKTSKILRYFEECHRYEISPDVANLRLKIVDDLKSCQSLTRLDVILCSRLKDLNTDALLSILNSWGSVRPDTLPSTVFYQAFLKVVRKGLWKAAPWNHLVQIVHFVGYLNGDQDTKSLMILFLHAVNESSSLSHANYKDVCIICEAAFRTSTGISSPRIRERITQILENLTDEVTDDSVWLVMLIKMMVFSKFYDVALLENLAADWISSGSAEKMPCTAQCYVLSLFAHAGVKHDRLFEIFTKSVGSKMQNSPHSLRVKDVSMFLWAVSTLSFNLNPQFLEHVVHPYLLSQLNSRNLSEGLSIIIKCCLAVWMLGPLPKSLFDNIITMDSFQTIREKSKNYRDLSRFALLLNIVEAETSDALSSEQKSVGQALSSTRLLVPNLQKEVEKRPGLQELIARLRAVGFSDVRLEYPVLIYVAGVTALADRRVAHFDLLDLTVSLPASNQPTGLLFAKVKLLKLRFPTLRHTFVTTEDLKRIKRKEDWLDLLGLARV